MTPVFLDTVGLLAVWDVADQWHADASRIHARLLTDRRLFVTTPYVLAECANAAARRLFRRDVVALRDQLEARERLLYRRRRIGVPPGPPTPPTRPAAPAWSISFPSP